jgi:hypothetical protein
MKSPETSPDTLPLPAVLEERRSGPRYECQIKILYSKRGDSIGVPRGEMTWNIGRIVNVSQHGFGLLLQRGFVPGTVLYFEPLLPNWSAKEPLTARIKQVRPGPGSTLYASCMFSRALNDDEMRTLIVNGNATPPLAKSSP